MSILDDILAATRERVKTARRQRPVGRLEGLRHFEAARRDFAGALRGDALSFIAEAKQASPSEGVIRAGFDAAALGREYEDAGAAAMSVLTEPHFFKGSLDDLEAVREAVELPLIRKDFVVDPYQVVEARAHGADAILLIAAALDPGQLAELHAAADELEMHVLVEVHDVRELDRLDLDQVRILGVNNRNLKTFAVDPTHCLAVFEHVPDGIVRVAESGLKTERELIHLARHGVDAVLMGTTLLRARRPGDALARLRDAVEGATST